MLIIINFTFSNSQENIIDHNKIKENLNEIITGISNTLPHIP